MYSELSIRHSFSSKLSLFSFVLIFSIFTLLHVPSLEAGGWGKTDEVINYEGTSWNGVYFDMNGLHFAAALPNYSGTLLQNGTVSLSGQAQGDARYVIITSFNPGFTPPKSIEGFVKIVQEANPTYSVFAIDAKELGAKYAIDMIPMNNEDVIFWRLISTKDRLIKMGTNDVNENRRLNFFESIYIY